MAPNSRRPTVGGLSMKPTTFCAAALSSKRLKKTKQAKKEDTPGSDAHTNGLSLVSPFWKLSGELRNIIWEMAYEFDQPIKVVPKRPRSSKQKPHKSILDILLVSKQWYDESVIIFVSSAEFRFANFTDFYLASSKLAPIIKNNITSISWREPVLHQELDAEAPKLCKSFGSLKKLQIVIPDAAFRYCHYMISPVVLLRQDRLLMNESMFVGAFGLYGLRSLRGLEDFSWINEDPECKRRSKDIPNPLVPGRTIYECNWDAFSEWVRKDVTKAEGT